MNELEKATIVVVKPGDYVKVVMRDELVIPTAVVLETIVSGPNLDICYRIAYWSNNTRTDVVVSEKEVRLLGNGGNRLRIGFAA